MKRKSVLILTILLMAIGFAAVSTTLYLNGTTNVASNTTDFDVYFSKSIENGIEKKELIKDKTHIEFTAELHEVDEIYELKYEVTNVSKNYDVSVSLNVPAGNEYVRVTNDFDTSNLLARTTREGTLTLKVIKSVTEEITFPIEITITVNAVERTSLGSETIKNGTIYGVKRSIDAETTEWERIEDSVGLIANATKDGSEVRNDFDNIYPWSDIITYNYDDVTKTETAVYGDENFKFDGSNGQVLTRIPEFYYKREQVDGVEYQYISKYPQEGFTKSEAFSIGRYTMSGNATKIYSRSGFAPLVNTTITNFRNYARKLGDDFGQLDWRIFLIQMLYLVEYANYDSQEVLGRGISYDAGQTGIAPYVLGGCNQLGMKSGSLVNDGKHSMIYRGIEDIYSNTDQFIDGININDYQVYINYNPNTYEINKYDGDYRLLGYINSSSNIGWILKIGYDEQNSLVSFPVEVSSDNYNSISDYYRIKAGNQIVTFGGHIWRYTGADGFWYYDFDVTPTTKTVLISARLLRYA